MSVDQIELRRRLSDRHAAALQRHVDFCKNCKVGFTDPNWIIGLCPIGHSVATPWRRAEAEYLEGVFALVFDGDDRG